MLLNALSRLIASIEQTFDSPKMPLIAGIISTFIVFLVMISYFGLDFNERSTDEVDVLSTEVEALRLEVTQLKANMSTEKTKSNSLPIKLPPGQGIRFDSSINVDKEYQLLDKRLSVIEDAIIDSPERSLALYKLSEDIDDLKDDRITDLDNTKKEVDRVYSFSQWFMVAMFSVSVGLIGLAWNVLKKK